MLTINPDGFTARKAKTFQAEKVKKSIIYLVNECIKKLKLQDEKITSTCSLLKNIRECNPEIHFLHYQLQTAMRQQDVSNTRLYLEKTIKAVNNHSLSQDICIASIGNTEWEAFAVAEAIRLTREDCGREAEIRPASNAELELAANSIAGALESMRNHDPDMLDEIQEHVLLIRLFAGKVTMGFTDERILGAMMLRLPGDNIDPVLYYIEHIVHEASHMHLNCLMSMDPLILNARDERFISPIRPDPRPMTGVFHATFVSAKIARTFMKIYQSTKNADLLHPLAETLDETLRGLNEIQRHAKLTSHGKALITSVGSFVKEAISLPEWQMYGFNQCRSHRFGTGKTRVNDLYKAVA